MDSKLRGDIVVVPEQTNTPDGDLIGNAVGENHTSGYHAGENSHLYRDARRELPNEEALPLRNILENSGDRFEGDDTLPSPVIPGPAPPDGGLRAWVVMLASFLCNGIIFGTVNSLGNIFVELKRILENAEEENPATMASITLSLVIGMTFLLSMVAGILTDKLGIRITTIAGGAIATLGMFLSSIYYSQPSILLVTMGILVGTGSSLAYTPSLVILGHYFYKRIGIVNGFVTTGSSVFTILITELLKYVIEKHGLKAAFQILSGLMAVLMFCGFIFKPLMPDISSPSDGSSDSGKTRNGSFLNTEIWKNKRYVIWAFAIPSALFGYFVPYMHLRAYSTDVFGEEYNSKLLVQCIALTSGVGRLFFGVISDKPWVNRIILQQISFFSIGSLTMLLTAANQFWMFIVISLLMGLFDGCFI
ncbi:Monocarboxylate transporter 10, partial [Armadillidium nasatum]